MSRIQEECVDDHERGLEDPEEPLVSQDGRQRIRINILIKMDAGCGEVFDRPVDRTHADESRGAIQCDESRPQIIR